MRLPTLPSRVAGPLLVVVVLASLALGVLAGARLGEAASSPPTRELVFADPARLEGPPAEAWRSAGGFTGFSGPPALPGEVLYGRRVASVGSSGVILEGDASSVSVAYASPLRVYRIAAATAPLAIGDLVLIRLQDGRVTGVLRSRLTVP